MWLQSWPNDKQCLLSPSSSSVSLEALPKGREGAAGPWGPCLTQAFRNIPFAPVGRPASRGHLPTVELESAWLCLLAVHLLNPWSNDAPTHHTLWPLVSFLATGTNFGCAFGDNGNGSYSPILGWVREAFAISPVCSFEPWDTPALQVAFPFLLTQAGDNVKTVRLEKPESCGELLELLTSTHLLSLQTNSEDHRERIF